MNVANGADGAQQSRNSRRGGSLCKRIFPRPSAITCSTSSCRDRARARSHDGLKRMISLIVTCELRGQLACPDSPRRPNALIGYPRASVRREQPELVSAREMMLLKRGTRLTPAEVGKATTRAAMVACSKKHSFVEIFMRG